MFHVFSSREIRFGSSQDFIEWAIRNPRIQIKFTRLIMVVRASPSPSFSLLPFLTSPYTHFLIGAIVTSARASGHAHPLLCQLTGADRHLLAIMALYCCDHFTVPCGVYLLFSSRWAGLLARLSYFACLLICLTVCPAVYLPACLRARLFARSSLDVPAHLRSHSEARPPSQRNE